MLWSTYGAKGYVEALAHSDTDDIIGNWCVDQELLFDSDGGHGMVFQNMEGRYYLALHYPNTYKKEHPCFLPLKYENGVFSSNG